MNFLIDINIFFKNASGTESTPHRLADTLAVLMFWKKVIDSSEDGNVNFFFKEL